MSKHKEIEFEKAIEHVLVTSGGYEAGDPKGFDAKTALFQDDVIDFIKATQSQKWDAVTFMRFFL